MLFVSRPAGLTFLLALALLSIVTAILACAPTAPDPQGETSKPTAEPTSTPELIYVHINGTLTPIEAPPAPVPNAAVPSDIRMQAERYIATREAQQTQGIRSANPLDPDKQPGQPPLNSTPKGPPQLTEANQTLSEDHRWCQAWALDNFPPHVYLEFAKLDPANMDDLQRTVWRERLGTSSAHTRLPTYRLGAKHPMPIGGDDRTKTCRVYWAERLSKANADKRNRQYEAACLSGLLRAADRRWPYLAEAAVRDADTAAYDIPNQYVRVLRWMHLTGEELLEMVDPPYELLKRLHDKKYAYTTNIPNTNDIANLKVQYNEDFSADWWGIVGATLTQNNSDEECRRYYPQLFYGYWVPFAEPDGDDKHEIPAELADEVNRLIEGALYLPKP